MATSAVIGGAHSTPRSYRPEAGVGLIAKVYGIELATAIT